MKLHFKFIVWPFVLLLLCMTNLVHAASSLTSNQQLTVNQYLASDNGKFRFYMQSDGNLVLRDWATRKSLWSSSTHGKGGVRVKMQSDGNLVLRNSSGSAIWSTKTANSGGIRLVMQDDGNLVIVNSSNRSVWSTNTAQSGGGSSIPEPAPSPTPSGSVSASEGRTLLVDADGWKYVYCDGSRVKVSSSSSKKQRWVKRGTRNIYNESVGKYLYCPERDGGYAPTDCVCSSKVENYHEKTSVTGGTGPANISLNRDIYIAPNNNFNACLKVIRGDQVHSPCAIEPWRNQSCRANNGTSFSSVEHARPCYKFRLNN